MTPAQIRREWSWQMLELMMRKRNERIDRMNGGSGSEPKGSMVPGPDGRPERAKGPGGLPSLEQFARALGRLN